MASSRSPCFERPTAGEPPTSRYDGEHLALIGTRQLEFAQPIESGQSEAARGGQRLRREFGLEREHRFLALHAAEHVLHDADGDAAILLLQLAALLPTRSSTTCR